MSNMFINKENHIQNQKTSSIKFYLVDQRTKANIGINL